MRTATVRQIQHHFKNVLRWVEHGEMVGITRRRHMVTKIVPIQKSTKAVDWSNLFERLHAIYGKKPVRGKTISDGREERL